jgi:hypothetical protein
MSKVMRSAELFATEVIPELRTLGDADGLLRVR